MHVFTPYPAFAHDGKLKNGSTVLKLENTGHVARYEKYFPGPLSHTAACQVKNCKICFYKIRKRQIAFNKLFWHVISSCKPGETAKPSFLENCTVINTSQSSERVRT